jgi:hypothetical protein
MERGLLYMLALPMFLACSSESEAGDDGAGQVTFYEDVAPIVYENCTPCHRPGSIAPFSLIDYASAKAVADDMARATEQRIMPPMPVDNSGSCNTFANARWLSDEEIGVIGEWAKAGAPEGDPAAAPPVPQPSLGLGAPDVTLDMGVDYTPNASVADDYRCFMVSSPTAELAFVTAYEVVPGDPRVVHHVIVYQPNDEVEAAEAHDLDAAQAGEGYTCFGGPGVRADPLVLWAPGGALVELPENTGIPLSGGRDLIMQIHYNLAEGNHVDHTKVHLAFAKQAVTPAVFQPIADTRLELAPGMPEAFTAAAFAPDYEQFTIYGMAPHMHTLGRTLRVDLTDEGTTTCLINVDRWDFHWQNVWWYDQPKTFSNVDSLGIRCSYDTTERSATVTWGEGTMDEMCLNYLYASSP